MPKLNRQSFAAAVVLAVCAAAPAVVNPPSARADAPASGAAVDQAKQMKAAAANPAQALALTMEMAKMMVMDHMAKALAMDPACQRACMEAMSDPAVIKARDDAKRMAQDSREMKQLQADIMTDPMAMRTVMHEAMKMATPAPKMDGGKMDGGKMSGAMMGGGTMGGEMAGDKMGQMKK